MTWVMLWFTVLPNGYSLTMAEHAHCSVLPVRAELESRRHVTGYIISCRVSVLATVTAAQGQVALGLKGRAEKQI